MSLGYYLNKLNLFEHIIHHGIDFVNRYMIFL